MLKEFESLVVNEEHENIYAFNTKESNPVKAIQLALQAFHPRGSDKCGVASDFQAYLDKKQKTIQNKNKHQSQCFLDHL